MWKCTLQWFGTTHFIIYLVTQVQIWSRFSEFLGIRTFTMQWENGKLISCPSPRKSFNSMTPKKVLLLSYLIYMDLNAFFRCEKHSSLSVMKIYVEYLCRSVSQSASHMLGHPANTTFNQNEVHRTVCEWHLRGNVKISNNFYLICNVLSPLNNSSLNFNFLMWSH